MRMSGNRTLVTGAASRIGKSAVSAFLQEGVKVIAADLTYADSTCPNGGAAIELHLDITNPGDWDRLLERAGPLDALVACAGVSQTSSIMETSIDDWHRVIMVNLDGVFLSLKYAARAVKKGSIVVVASASGVNASVSPAAVLPMWLGMPFWKDLVRQPSVQRMAFPEEIADAIVFLSCGRSARITGADLAIDAGYTA